MRILHTADWHIGRQFHNLSLLEDQRHVLAQLIELIDSRQVDVMLVAGDIYDRSVPPAAAVSLLDEVLHRICIDLGVPVIMIAGNHDGPERLGFGSRQLAKAGLYIAGQLEQELRPIILGAAGAEVAFYPIPYADPVTVRHLLNETVTTHDAAMGLLTQRILEHNRGRYPCVVLGHCFLAGGEVSESERPLSIGGAEWVSPEHFMPFEYAALGHLHGRQFRGAAHIRYSGSLLKYSFSEALHHKSVTLVDVDASGAHTIEQVDLQPLHDMRILDGALDELLQQGKTDPNFDDYLLVRLTDSHAILDIMGKLRSVYPNVLHLERPGLMVNGEQRALHRDQLKRGELAMFQDFYQQMRGEPLTQEQCTIIAEVLESVHKEGPV
ncbi:exonuclease SbcCD subunit D [Sedimenticola selenatireducens]|uniref:Nuclease SbcCD subunit D n=1 Tax=Sedimenticola selenatireducens TaxID=191960 RepID=A0A558DW19_9GAMM|nr:exonuclease SbcCD subunit D [Sedimenticola selenatireducens]TVO77793.1 exonuclease SbcCD subunit D [Sedimenticola selenatireducens]TVT65098.1 MAG: exonuclease SbcCD subunit D [Sedimenticola selenatireducens]